MNFARAAYYPFHGDKWFKRLLIGAIFSVIPIVNLMIEGYANEVTRQVARGNDGTSPPWKHLGRYFIEGTSQWIARVVHFGLLLAVGILLRLPFLRLPRRVVGIDGPIEELARWRFVSITSTACITLFILVLAVWLGFYLLASDIRYSTGESRFSQLFEIKQNVQYFAQHRGKIIFAWFSSTAFWLTLTLISLMFGAIPIPILSETFAVVFFLTNGFILRIFTAHIHGQVALQTMENLALLPADGVY